MSFIVDLSWGLTLPFSGSVGAASGAGKREVRNYIGSGGLLVEESRVLSSYIESGFQTLFHACWPNFSGLPMTGLWRFIL